MSVKTLRKQLFAAIAMVMVAAIALGSSTYAWFVTNNTVKATTSQISAQSNAAFMNIKYNATAVNSDLTADVATLGSEKLYPAQWKNNFDASKGKTDPKIYQFETAYAQTVGEATMDNSSLKAIGTPAEAVAAHYAVKNVFNISSKGTGLTDLKVTGCEIKSGDNGNAQLDNALRVLVVCGDNWVVCNKTGIVESSHTTAGYLAAAVTAGSDTEVDLYVYYDGNESEIYTNNLANLSDSSSKITITFGATATNS